jgi:hypothetical protein
MFYDAFMPIYLIELNREFKYIFYFLVNETPNMSCCSFIIQTDKLCQMIGR